MRPELWRPFYVAKFHLECLHLFETQMLVLANQHRSYKAGRCSTDNGAAGRLDKNPSNGETLVLRIVLCKIWLLWSRQGRPRQNTARSVQGPASMLSLTTSGT